ncbi:hypothetical protein BU25DRAFT_461944 [Macroventuria anomochaeta]|uniref:Uncharacterized protein n=1 Tax=Macroventuria anomochaeta TaxID=301207 RepID=A0ACB6RNN7_9PLEO|nr:uncharacterized protein BU25DRAFT_461944 [Macroventuria anomochaeta]KAF2623565.1 hypothetical protein BU25DRAFT_461944 [Macroventuria anomochaeta]
MSCQEMKDASGRHPRDSVNGSFIFPRTYPLTFREGSSINISWSKTYENINLYFYQRGKVANSVQLVTNLATEWYQWEVHAEETNLTNPFVFRIVNAQGTTEEQNGEGFWSTSCRIFNHSHVIYAFLIARNILKGSVIDNDRDEDRSYSGSKYGSRDAW